MPQDAQVAATPGFSGWVGTVLGARDAQALAYFYRDLLGWSLAEDTPKWCTIPVPGARANLAFQQEPTHEPPTWPQEQGKPQMMIHLDLGTTDLARAVRHAISLGAVEAQFQPQADVRVMIDPAGHPFCLYVDDE